MNGQNIHPLNKSEILKQYTQYIQDRIVNLSKFAAPLTIAVVSYYVFIDFELHIFYPSMFYFRIAPIALGVLVLIMLLPPLRKHKKAISITYISMLSAIMIMGTATVVLARVYNEKSIIGLLIIIFSVYALSVYGIKLLLPLYSVTLLASIIILLSTGKVSRHELFQLANPVVFAIICIIISGFTEKLRYQDFVKSKIIENQNDEIRYDMELAKSIQQNIIPLEYPLIPNLKISALYRPMIHLGGDFYDFVKFKEQEKLGVFICDVSGHGTSAALIASMVKTLLNTAGLKKFRPVELLNYINNQLIKQTSGKFITAFYGVFDSLTMKLEYARAGHPYPIIIRENKLIKLKSKGHVLAMFSTIEIEEREIDLMSGDKILLYTDGLTESVNREKVMYEYKLETILLENQDKDIAAIIDSTYAGLIDFIGSDDFEDDICIIGVEVV